MRTSRSFHIVILTILATLLLAGTTAKADLDERLVGRWKFDEGFGSTAYDWVGDNDGIIYGAQWTIGQIDGALDFDGLNDRVEVPHSASLSIVSAVTISTWVKPDTLPGSNRDIVVKAVDNKTNSARCNYNLRTTAEGKLQYNFRDSADTTFPVYQTTDVVLSVDTWYYVCVVHQFGNGSDTKIYVNGIPQPASWIQGTGDEVPKTGNYPLEIGAIRRGGGSFTNFFDGKIDDVRIYVRALSADEILELYEYQQSVDYATDQIQEALAEKDAALEAIDAALQKETKAYSTLEEVLATHNYGDLQKTDIAKAKRGINSAMRQQGRAENILQKSITGLEDSLVSLGWQPQPEPEPNLVAHWKFDEGSGSTAYDSAGTNDGTLVGDTAWTPGLIGGALSFDGDDDYVEIPDSPELRFIDTQPFTVSLWFMRSVDTDSTEFMLVKGFRGDPENTNYVLHLAPAPGGVRWAWEHGSGTNDILDSGVIPAVGQWYHAVGVWDGTIQIIYVNGAEANSTIPAAKPSSGSNRPVVIGKILAGTGPAAYDFNGSIDDVRIYDRALTALEVQLLYQDTLD